MLELKRFPLVVQVMRFLSGPTGRRVTYAGLVVFFLFTLIISFQVSSVLSFVVIVACVSLSYGVYLSTWVLQKDEGTAQMIEISDAIRDGAEARFHYIIRLAVESRLMCCRVDVSIHRGSSARNTGQSAVCRSSAPSQCSWSTCSGR